MIRKSIRYGLTMKYRANRRDGAATIDKDGNVSNSQLHEQMTEGVDDYSFRMETRAKLLAQGVPVSALDLVLPVEPKNNLSTQTRHPKVEGGGDMDDADLQQQSAGIVALLRAGDARGEFDKRVMEEFLPQFCEHYGYNIAGFNAKTLNRISEYDALWFLKALDAKVVTADRAFFESSHSGAREQIFWQYGKLTSLRKITLWAEPVITIGAAGRLHCQFGWPKERIGLQSKKNWAFDLVAYGDSAGSNSLVVCEVKKSKSEVDYLIQAMQEHFPRPALSEDPTGQKLRNAYRKVRAMREMKPALLWILGPENYGKLFRVVANATSKAARLEEIEEDELGWRGSG